MGDVVNFSGWTDRDVARLERFIEHGEVAAEGDAELDAEVAALGTPDDWARSAIEYLKASLEGTLEGSRDGSVTVSAAAVGLLLGHVDRLTATGRSA